MAAESPRGEGTPTAGPYGFVGLGAMGYHMAANLALAGKVVVWNRTSSVAERHSSEHGTILATSIEGLSECKLVSLCVPTSSVSRALCEILVPLMQTSGAVILDHTSGNPLETREIADFVHGISGGKVTYVDAPVSGGPAGAKAATLTTMVGCSKRFAADLPSLTCALNTVAKRVVFLDTVGAGNAVKCVNNFMNVSHLALASECMYGLGLAGVNVGSALEAINHSSGRSLQTEVRLPTQVLNGRYRYGFDLELMLKDVRQAVAFLKDTFEKKNTHISEQDMLLPGWGTGLENLLLSALSRDTQAQDSTAPDYTRSVARYFELVNLPGMPSQESSASC